jgi:hypothetical protein
MRLEKLNTTRDYVQLMLDDAIEDLRKKHSFSKGYKSDKPSM